MLIKNLDVEQHIESLKPLLHFRNIIGYTAARNMRTLQNSAVEYIDFKDSLIRKYGKEIPDENGNMTVGIMVNTPDYDEFLKEIGPLSEIVHDLDIMPIKYADVIGILSGEEILSIDWMLED